MQSIEEMLAGIKANQGQVSKQLLTIEEMLQGKQAGGSAPSEPESQSILDWFKGGKREETIPLIERANLGLPSDKAAQMVALLATTASDDRLQSGIKKIMPNAQFDQDKFGNLVVIAPVYRNGEETQQYTRFYPNPKGLNPVDIMQGAGAIAAGQGLAMTGGMLGLPVTGLLGGGLLGMTEAALVEAASSKLSDDPFQVFDVPAGLLGGMAGAKVSDVLGSLIAKLKSKPSAVLDENGNLTPKMRGELTALGLDPDNITAEIAAKLRQDLTVTSDPKAVARVAESRSLPVEVPLTRGEATGSRAQQLLEDQAETGNLGEGTRGVFERLRGKQQQALGENITAIQSGFGGDLVEQSGQGAAAAQQTLAARRAAEQQAAGQMFEDARKAGSAFVSFDKTGELSENLNNIIRDFNPSETQATRAVLDELDEVLATSGDVTSIFQLRQRLSNTGNAGSPEYTAAQRVKRNLDSFLKELVDDQLLYGNPEAVTKQLAAIRNYADFAGKWKSGGILDTLTTKTSRDGGRVFKVAPESVANYIFGVKGAKLVSGTSMVRDLRTLKKTLPEKQWNELRQEAFVLISNRAFKTGRDGQTEVSGAAFQTFWNNMKKSNPDIIKTLFTKEEIKQINTFASVASRVTSGAKNYSNTATSSASLISSLLGASMDTTLGRLAVKAPFVRWITGGVAEQSLKRPIKRGVGPMALGGAGGALTAGDVGGQMQYDQYEGMTGVQIPR